MRRGRIFLEHAFSIIRNSNIHSALQVFAMGSQSPSASPSMSPSFSPSKSPSASPSMSPSLSPSNSPSVSPSELPEELSDLLVYNVVSNYSTYNELSLPPSDNDAISLWESSDDFSHNFAQSTLSLMPTYQAAEISGWDALQFDGTDDYLRYAGTMTVLDVGTFVTTIKTPASFPANDICILATQDESSNTEYLEIGINSSGKVFLDLYNSGEIPRRYRVVGNTVLSVNTSYHISITANSIDWIIKVNDVVQTLTVESESNSGHWFGTLTGRDSVSIGRLLRSTPIDAFVGFITFFALYSVVKSDSDLTSIYQWSKTRYNHG